MQYRRSNAIGGTFFFTVNLQDRSSRLLTKHIDVLRESVRKVRHSHHVDIVAMVVLPDHLHAIWTLPPGDFNYPIRWSLIKAGFSRKMEPGEPANSSRGRKRERGIWQRRYWEHEGRDDIDLTRHIEYIHFNPVKHKHVTVPAEWPYSSIHRYIRQGVLTPDWAAGVNTSGSGFGERG